nr:RNA-directed DNA polymerase, eukaryota [Tanacetum cinerariifolium]
YRPISLIGSRYKIIGKLLANRIALVVEDIVSVEESAFVKGRQIMDGSMILNEILNWCRKVGKKLVFKVDYEKAYDTVCWEFLQEVMKKKGFGNKWCAWIRGCLESSMASVLVNGSPTGEFKVQRGLRQGDPLSPFLFILVMEGMHMVIENAMSAGRLSGIQVGIYNIAVSHLFYADDAVFLEEWNNANINKIVLLNKFFWGMEMGEKKLTWIKWKKTMARKEDGGLGIRSLYGFNRALIYKWKWRFHTTPDALWVKITKSIFGYDGGLLASRLDMETNAMVNARINLSLDSVCLRRHRWVWSGDGTWGFTVESVRSIIDTGFLVNDNTPTRWSKVVPIKINVFMWKLLFDKLPTRDNLEKKGLDVPSILCGICDDVTETASHVFLRCEFALEIWRQIARWWDLDIPHMLSMKELLGWVDNLKISKIQKKGLYNIVITATWSI